MKKHLLELRFDSTVIDAVIELDKKFEYGRIMFAGSFALKLCGEIVRNINDLDVFTSDELYGSTDESLNVNRKGSGKFEVNGKFVTCVHGETDSGINVDFLYRDDIVLKQNRNWRFKSNAYFTVDFHGVTILVQEPKFAVEAKRQYVESPQLRNKAKHNKDLRYIDAKRHNDDLPF